MNNIGYEGNGRNLPLFNAIKSTGTFLERYEKPKPKAAAAAAPASPPNPPRPPKNSNDKKEPTKDNKKRPPEGGLGGLVKGRK
jgi:hypothetical protein